MSLAAGAPAPEGAAVLGSRRRSGSGSGWRTSGQISGWNHPNPAFWPPPLGQVPLTLDPASAVVTDPRPRGRGSRLVRSFILQLAAFPSRAAPRLLVHGPADTVPLAARFLPGVTLSANEATTAGLLTGGPGGPGGDIRPRDPHTLGHSRARRAAAGAEAAGAGPALRSLATAHGWTGHRMLP